MLCVKSGIGGSRIGYGFVCILFGDYYIQKKKLLEEEAEAGLTKQTEGPPRPNTSAYIQKKEAETLARRKNNRIIKLEAEIAGTEELIRNCDRQLNDESIATNAEAAAAIYNEKTDLEDKLLKLYEEWEATI